MVFGLLIGFLVITGLVATQLGLTHTAIVLPHPSPPSGTGFWDAIRSVLLPLAYVFNVFSSILQILTFQMDIPLLANGIIMTPIYGFILWAVVALVRGGG